MAVPILWWFARWTMESYVASPVAFLTTVATTLASTTRAVTTLQAALTLPDSSALHRRHALRLRTFNFDKRLEMAERIVSEISDAHSTALGMTTTSIQATSYDCYSDATKDEWIAVCHLPLTLPRLQKQQYTLPTVTALQQAVQDVSDACCVIEQQLLDMHMKLQQDKNKWWFQSNLVTSDSFDELQVASISLNDSVSLLLQIWSAFKPIVYQPTPL